MLTNRHTSHSQSVIIITQGQPLKDNEDTERLGLNLIIKNENKISDIPIIKIRPNKAQPRKVFNEEDLNALSQSITENGILQPLTVRKVSATEYELIAGERRLRASVMAGLRKVPCIVIKCSEKESAVYALLENLQRSDLGMFEEARGISRLIRRYGLTQQEAAVKLGKTQSTIANKLRLLRLTYEEQEWIENAGLSERHARALLKLGDEGARREALSKIISENLNVQQSENLVNLMLNSSSKNDKKQGFSKAVIKDVRIFVNTINKAVDTMRLAGIDAQTDKTDTDNFIEYTIRIPKKQITDEEKTA